MIPSFRALCSNVNKLAKQCEKHVNIYPSLSNVSSSYHLYHSDERNKTGLGPCLPLNNKLGLLSSKNCKPRFTNLELNLQSKR